MEGFAMSLLAYGFLYYAVLITLLVVLIGVYVVMRKKGQE